MEFLDEKIAELEQLRQIIKQEEKEELAQENEKLDGDNTIEDVIEAFREGSVKIEDKLYLVEYRKYFENKFVLPIMPELFNEVVEEEQAIVWVNDKEGISIVVTYLPEEMLLKEIHLRKKEIETGFKKNNLYVEWLKEELLEKLDYVSFRIPSAGGWLYNLIFWVHTNETRIVGSLNCLDKNKKTQGVVLEAILHEINRTGL